MATAAAVAAIPAAGWTLATTVPLLPPELHGLTDVGPDLRVAAAIAVMTALATVLFGLAPALSIGSTGQDALRESQGTSAHPFWRRFRGALVVAEVAIAVVLLSGAVTIIATVTAEILIAVIHEVGEADNVTFVAMELIRGEKLSELIARGSLTWARALALAEGLRQDGSFAEPGPSRQARRTQTAR